MNSKILMLVACSLLAASLPAGASSVAGSWDMTLADSNPSWGGVTGLLDIWATTTGGAHTGTFTALTQTDNWTGCATLPCTWNWSGSTTGGGTGIDIVGVGSYE